MTRTEHATKAQSTAASVLRKISRLAPRIPRICRIRRICRHLLRRRPLLVRPRSFRRHILVCRYAAIRRVSFRRYPRHPPNPRNLRYLRLHRPRRRPFLPHKSRSPVRHANSESDGQAPIFRPTCPYPYGSPPPRASHSPPAAVKAECARYSTIHSWCILLARTVDPDQGAVVGGCAVTRRSRSPSQQEQPSSFCGTASTPRQDRHVSCQSSSAVVRIDIHGSRLSVPYVNRRPVSLSLETFAVATGATCPAQHLASSATPRPGTCSTSVPP